MQDRRESQSGFYYCKTEGNYRNERQERQDDRGGGQAVKHGVIWKCCLLMEPCYAENEADNRAQHLSFRKMKDEPGNRLHGISARKISQVFNRNAAQSGDDFSDTRQFKRTVLFFLKP